MFYINSFDDFHKGLTNIRIIPPSSSFTTVTTVAAIGPLLELMAVDKR